MAKPISPLALAAFDFDRGASLDMAGGDHWPTQRLVVVAQGG
ncbi:hypothetical protein AB0873_31775 [Micromonospora sp. NPDC047707]